MYDSDSEIKKKGGGCDLLPFGFTLNSHYMGLFSDFAFMF